ncbi:MAG: hypothetical protein AAF639_11210 [Chloroflexota bacterium]
MTMNISLTGEISENIHNSARRLRLSAQTFIDFAFRVIYQNNHIEDEIEKEIRNSEPFNKFSFIEDERRIDDDDIDDTLEGMLAAIKVTPPNPNAVTYGEKFGDMDYIQYLLDTPPTDTMTMEEWEEVWPAFEQEQKVLNRLDDITEGRFYQT